MMKKKLESFCPVDNLTRPVRGLSELSRGITGQLLQPGSSLQDPSNTELLRSASKERELAISQAQSVIDHTTEGCDGIVAQTQGDTNGQSDPRIQDTREIVRYLMRNLFN